MNNGHIKTETPRSQLIHEVLFNYLEEESLRDATVLPFLLLDRGEEQMSGGDSLVGDPLPTTHHPQEHVGQAVLRL